MALTLGLVAACAGGPGKDSGVKPAIAADKGGLTRLGKADSASGSGRWVEVRAVETAHPYANHSNQTFTVRGSGEALRMKVVFERFELEAGYDFVTVSDASGGQPSRHTGLKTGHELVLSGNAVQIVFTSDYSITGWGARIRVFEEEPCICTADYRPVCGADGNTYSNSCTASCADAEVRYLGECRSEWLRLTRTIASPHDYSNNFDQTWTISEGGARRMRVHFTRLDLEQGYDHLRVLDGNGNVVQVFTGSGTDVTSREVEGDTIKLQLVTDYSIVRWGFEVDWYEVTGGCESDAECGAGARCIQPQCFRAPCFAVCSSDGAGTGYEEVTAAALSENADAYNGRRVKVVAEPYAEVAMCTRVACSEDNPCCNRCAAGFKVGAVALADAAGNPYGCTGNECTYLSNCNPFRHTEQNGPYELKGTFQIGEAGALVLRLDSFAATDCQRGGCSGQLCSNGPGGISTCEWREEYACYRTASCETQPDGHCAWTPTPELHACLGQASQFSGAATDTPIEIPDNDPAGITSRILVPSLATVQSLTVSVDITHTYRGDLVVSLVAPDGTESILSNRAGRSADNLVLSNVAQTVFNGKNAAGEWLLRVSDHAGIDVGTLNSWSLAINRGGL